MFKAIARFGKVDKPTSTDFVDMNELGNPSTILQSLDALSNKELIYKERDQTGAMFYSVYDPFFREWVLEKFHVKYRK